MADVAETEAQVITCIKALFSAKDPVLAKEADHWLKQFQVASPLAWTVADRILHNPALTSEVQFYAASTLYLKIQQLASIELTPPTRASLRDSLIANISIHSKGYEPLRSKLAQSIAALALHMGSEWVQVVPDLVASFTRSPELVPALLSILEVLPEESENYHSTSRVSKDVANAFRAQIRNSAPDMIRNLGSPALLGAASTVDAQTQLLRCFANWLRACDETKVSAALSGNPLMLSAFDALGSHELFDAALAAVCELVLVSTHHDLRQLVEYSVSRAQSYRPAFVTAVKDEDEQTAKGFCHVFTEMAEAYLPMLLLGDATVLPLAEVMLECVAHTGLDTAAITFHFWQQLGEGLTKCERKDIVEAFAKSIFPRLFEHLYRIACYTEEFSTLPRDMQEDFRDARKNEVTATLRTTCTVMGTPTCFGQIAGILQKQLGPDGYPKTGNWRLLEGAIFCMRALARCVDEQPGVDPMIGSILKILPQLPNHKEIHYTSLLIVGRYADWIKTDPSLLWPLFSYVIAALGHADTAPSAALSFKNICTSCAQMIAATHLQDIIKIACSTMQSSLLHIEDHVEVIEGVSLVISTLPFDASISSLQTLCLPIITAIQQYAPKLDLKSTLLADSLCMLASLFLSIKTFRNHPDRTAPIAEAIWPHLEPIFSIHATDTHVIDQLFRCIRYLLDDFPKSFTPTSTVLPSLLTNIKSTYKIARNPNILYTTTAFLKYNSRNPDHIAILWDLILDLSHTTLKAQLDAVADADMVSEYCSMMEFGIIDFAPQIKGTSGLVESIAQWGGHALVQISQLSRQDRHQREAFYSICKLLNTMMQEGMDFTTTGDGLVRSVFTCIAICGISLARATSLCDLLRRLVRYPHANTWLTSAVETILPNAVPHAPKSKFLTALAHASNFPITDDRKRDKHPQNGTNGVKNGHGNGSGNGNSKEANGRDHRAEEAERELVNSAMDLADICRKFRR